MPGVLLDTHALYWLVSGEEQLSDAALLSISENQASGTLYVSPITAWELSIAARKPARRNPPQMNVAADAWFRAAVRATKARVVPIGARIAIEAAEVPSATGHKDPGDCFLIATSRVKEIPIITRDGVMLRLRRADYPDVIVC